MNFSNISSPNKRPKRSHIWVPPKRARKQEVQIGQVIHPEKNTVEFVARVGRKVVGLSNFVYHENEATDITEQRESGAEEYEYEEGAENIDESEDVDSSEDEEDGLPSYEDLF